MRGACTPPFRLVALLTVSALVGDYISALLWRVHGRDRVRL